MDRQVEQVVLVKAKQQAKHSQRHSENVCSWVGMNQVGGHPDSAPVAEGPAGAFFPVAYCSHCLQLEGERLRASTRLHSHWLRQNSHPCFSMGSPLFYLI